MNMASRILLFVLLAAGFALSAYQAESKRAHEVLEKQKQENIDIEAELDAELVRIARALEAAEITPEEASELRKKAYKKTSAQAVEAMERALSKIEE